MRYLFILFILFSRLCSNAQNTFHNYYGNNTGAESMVLTAKGDYMTTGRLEVDTFNRVYESYLSKIDKSGNVLWTKAYINSYAGYSTEGYWIEKLNDNKFIDVSLSLDVTQSRKPSFLLFKTDSMGNILLSKRIDSVLIGVSTYFEFKIRNNNSYYISGTWQSAVGGRTDIFVIETDSNFTVKWTKKYSFGINSSINDEFIFQDFIISQDKIILTGIGYRVNNNTAGEQSALLVLDSLGNVSNCKITNSVQQVFIFSVLKYDANNLFLFGDYSNVIAGTDNGLSNLIIKIDENFNIKWVKTFGAQIDFNTASWVIYKSILSLDGNIVILSSSDNDYSNAYFPPIDLMKIDTIGNIKWQHILNDTTVAGYGANSINHFGAYNFVENTDKGISIIGECDHSGSGYNWSKTQLIKTDSMGNQPCNYGMMNFFNTANNLSLITATPTVTLLNLTSTTVTINSYNINLSPLDFCSYSSLGIEKYNGNQDFYVYPNPSNGHLKIDVTKLNSLQIEIDIQDITGRTVLVEKNISNSKLVELNMNLSSGLYILKVQSNGIEIRQKKIIINN